MTILLGSVDPYPMLLAGALVLSALLLVGGLAVWLGLWSGNHTWAVGAALAMLVVAHYLIPNGKPVIRALIVGVVLVVIVAAVRARSQPREAPATAEAAAARTRWFRIGLVAIVAVSALPLVALRVLRVINQEDPLPVATVAGRLSLSPDQPIAIVDTSVRLTGGSTGLDASVSGVDRTDLPYWLTESRTIRLDDAGGTTGYGSLGIDDTCTDCTYRFRTAFTLDPTVQDPTESTYEMWFSWSPDEYEWERYDVGSLPSVTMETGPASIDPVRIGSNEIMETTSWTASRPFDLRLITVHIDDLLIPESGLRSWPAIGRNYAILDMYDEDGAYVDGHNVWHVTELDADCLLEGCSDYSYIVPIILEDETEEVPATVELWVYHWIDLLDGSRPEGAIVLASNPPHTWIEAATAGDVVFTSDGRHPVSFQISVEGVGRDTIGSGVAILTAHADSDAIHVSGQPARTDSEIRYVRHLHGCEQPTSCEISFVADGDIGDTASWTLEYHYGFFGETPASPDAEVVISDPQITTLDR